MKCKNCGEDNAATRKRCSGCNSPLDGTNLIYDQDKLKDYIGDNEVLCKNCKKSNPVNALRCIECNSPLDGSIAIVPKRKLPEPAKAPRGTAVKHEPLASEVKGNLISCPSCNFANIPVSSNCSKCGSPLNASIISKDKLIVKREKNQPELNSAQPISTATINPFVQKTNQPQFQLTPIEGGVIDTINTLHFVGSNVKLNRSNLDENNNTISSKEQAEIVFSEGRFVLQDKSSFRSTFIQVNPEYELKNGDIILMGNRLFVFNHD